MCVGGIAGAPQYPTRSLAEDDAVFEPIHETAADVTPRHPLDPLPQLLFPLGVVLLGQLGVQGGQREGVRELRVLGGELIPSPFPTKAILSPLIVGGGRVLKGHCGTRLGGPFRTF